MEKPAATSTVGATTPGSSAPAPTVTGRHDFVDALRGFALLGILLVNIEYIVQPSEIGWLDYTEPIDQAVRWLVIAFGQTKIYPLFALLFGYGLALQMAKPGGGSDAELAARYRRRMLGIGLLGVLHGVGFFPGDILVIYAVVGAIAFRLRHLPSRRLLEIAAAVYALAALGWLAVGALELTAGGSVPTASAEAVAVLTSGSYPEVVAVHAFYWLATLAILSVVQGPAVFAAFLAGVALGRTDWLADPAAHRRLAKRVLRVAAPIGVLGSALGASLSLLDPRTGTLGFAIGFAAAPAMAAAYLAALALLIGGRRTVGGRVLQASGRMSLSVYLLESVVATTLAYGYGFGWFGSIGPLEGVLAAVAIWAGLSAAAVGWLKFARLGPFEWALRSFTYRKWQPIRR